MKRYLLLFFVFLLPALGAAEMPYLFQNGQALWKVTCRTEEDLSDAVVKHAARELLRAMRLVSQAKKTDGAAEKTVVCLGVDKTLKEEEIRIYFDGKKLQISGGESRSVIHAVNYFLQKELGVRWLWPGESGEFMPYRESYQIPEKLDIRHIPSIKYRGFHMCGDWYKVNEFREWMSRNFINIHRHAFNFRDEFRFVRMWADHNIRLNRDLFKEHPEYFAEIDGRRIPSQVCLNHPEVDRLMFERLAEWLSPRLNQVEIVNLFLEDNQEYCRCSLCKEKGVSTSWFDFYNRLTDKLKAEFPKLKFATLAYQGYMAVPANPVRNSEFVEYASHNRCNIHKYGEPDCQRNVKTWQQKLDWKATGVPMGDYAYEFDIFSGPDTPFTPFYDLIKDTVQRSVEELQLVALIPEVGLSPKKGPDHMSHLKERLGNYIYAQLMWDHTQSVNDLIDNWCDLAYGNAAGKMKEYFRAMNEQWNSMKIHFGILGNPMSVAAQFMTPEFQKKMGDLLLAAEKDLNGEKNEALEFEKLIFAAWLRHLETGERINLPKNAEGKYGSWSDTAGTMTLNAGKAPFHIELCAGFGGETWIFTAGKDGNTKHWRRSTVGVDEKNWKAEWSYADGKVTIPFASLGETPKGNTKWLIKNSADGKAQTLYFSNNSETGKKMLYWNGRLPECTFPYAGFKKATNDFGWEVEFLEKDADITKMPTADIYYFWNPGHSNAFPKEQWAFLREQIRNGATAVFAAYSSYPLDKIMDDPTWKVGVAGTGKIQLSQRHTKTIYPGEWSQTPYKIKKNIERGYTPAYNLRPGSPEYWRILATLPEHGGDNAPEQPFFMVRPYGKGTVICYALDLWFGLHHTLANILYNRDPLTADLPLSKAEDDANTKEKKSIFQSKQKEKKSGRKNSRRKR